MASYRFLVADDHPLFRGALRQALEGMIDGLAIAEAGSLADVVTALEADREADLVLLDLSMPGVQGFSGLIYLRAEFPDIPVVIVSATEDAAVIHRSLDFGASGFIPKSTSVDQIRAAVLDILRGNVWTPPDVDLSRADDGEPEVAGRLAKLTPQQIRVLMMLSRGLLNKQIAYELDVSEATVKAHVSAILQKLNVDSRTQAVIAASRIEAGSWHPEMER